MVHVINVLLNDQLQLGMNPLSASCAFLYLELDCPESFWFVSVCAYQTAACYSHDTCHTITRVLQTVFNQCIFYSMQHLVLCSRVHMFVSHVFHQKI